MQAQGSTMRRVSHVEVEAMPLGGQQYDARAWVLTCDTLFKRNLSVVMQTRPPDGIPTLTWWGLRGQMNPRAMLPVAYATGRASHARQVKGDDPDEKGYPVPPGGVLGTGLTTLPCKN
jgi:hypothetical protein